MNLKVTNWVSEVGTLALTNQTDSFRPTNSITGVGFKGTTWLSNTAPFNIITDGSAGHRTGSVYIVCSLITAGGSLGAIIGDGTTGGNGLYTTSGNQFKWFGAGGSGTIADYVSGSAVKDIAVIITNTVSGQMLWYTNNVFINTAGIGAGDMTNPQEFVGADGSGGGGAHNPTMFLLDLLYYYGKLAPADVSTLHTYFTNLYSFSP